MIKIIRKKIMIMIVLSMVRIMKWWKWWNDENNEIMKKEIITVAKALHGQQFPMPPY